MKRFKNYFLLGFLLVIFVLISAISYVDAVSNNISDSVFRLHIIANSDSDEDQNLKYMVRNEILTYINQYGDSFNNKEDIINFINENNEEIQHIAQKSVYNNGYEYPVSIEVGNFSFPTKTYGDISLPAGYYDALRIKVGKATGQNWWCVMFPTLCFVDLTSGIVEDDSKEVLETSLNDEEYALISTQDSPTLNFKFKLLEMFETFNIGLAKNN